MDVLERFSSKKSISPQWTPVYAVIFQWMREGVASNPSFIIQLRYPVPIPAPNSVAGRQIWKNSKNQVWSETCQQLPRIHLRSPVIVFRSRKFHKPSQHVVLRMYWSLVGRWSRRRTIWGSFVRRWILGNCWQVSENQFLRFPQNRRSVAQNGIKHD